MRTYSDGARFSPGEPRDELGAVTGLARDGDAAAVLERDRADDREPETGSALGGARREERLEELGLLVGRNPRAGVADDEADLVRGRFDAYHDRAAGGRRRERVLDQVEHDLLELVGVGVDHEIVAR